MRVRPSLVILCILLVALCSNCYVAKAIDYANYDASFEMTLYSPTKVVVNFAYTQNFSITNVNTLGNSLWTQTGSPIMCQFACEAYDTYEFDVVIGYDKIIDQVIMIAMWSGNLPVQNIPLHVETNEVRLHFKLSVVEQPKAPTPEEVAEAVVGMLAQDMQYYFDQVSLLTRQFEENLVTQWIIIAVVSVTSVFSLIVSIYLLRRR